MPLNKGGGGHFQSKKFHCRFWTFIIIKGFREGSSEKKLHCDFPKIKGRGSKAVCNFSENSSVFVALIKKGLP